VPPRVMREQFGDEAKVGTAEAKPKPHRHQPAPPPKSYRPPKSVREKERGHKRAGHADHRR
jgi:hypothetical protein